MDKPDKNKSRTRLEQRESDIMDAASKLFAEEGFHATSTRKIAAAAGVSEGTLFHYYGTKNVLLLAILDGFYEQLIESAREGVESVMGTRERLLLLAKNHLRALMDNQALMMRLIQVYLSVDIYYYQDYKKSPIHKLNYRYTRIFDNVVREGMERGYIREDLELSAMRDLFFGGLEYGMRTLMGRKYNRERVASYVEAIVDPLWQSMQTQHSTADSNAADNSRLEATCKRLESIVERLEQA
ncbi:TetR/AcrR family transcriptional regulator [Pseudohalioglobus lutimaris]|uniref:TetR family transcriptional regulator n=1 Tax=Pseudohalioglobus lutimaris TaxID=1737061 RepID=A0A2N5X8R7_9GAMM|nr:TetR/AcrR family transcriptional regulator [Pseudohalioglobus lutimaris]PLW70890.1 TetR family transcriptional regulator [Pseudohalioglobus lutimaris]